MIRSNHPGLDEATVNSWWEAQTESMGKGCFFAAANYYTFLARKV